MPRLLFVYHFFTSPCSLAYFPSARLPVFLFTCPSRLPQFSFSLSVILSAWSALLSILPSISLSQSVLSHYVYGDDSLFEIKACFEFNIAVPCLSLCLIATSVCVPVYLFLSYPTTFNSSPCEITDYSLTWGHFYSPLCVCLSLCYIYVRQSVCASVSNTSTPCSISSYEIIPHHGAILNVHLSVLSASL